MWILFQGRKINSDHQEVPATRPYAFEYLVVFDLRRGWTERKFPGSFCTWRISYHIDKPCHDEAPDIPIRNDAHANQSLRFPSREVKDDYRAYFPL